MIVPMFSEIRRLNLVGRISGAVLLFSGNDLSAKAGSPLIPYKEVWIMGLRSSSRSSAFMERPSVSSTL